MRSLLLLLLRGDVLVSVQEYRSQQIELREARQLARWQPAVPQRMSPFRVAPRMYPVYQTSLGNLPLRYLVTKMIPRNLLAIPRA